MMIVEIIKNLVKFGVELQKILNYNIAMIKRTILKEIEHSVKTRPITLLTGARQVGKTTLALLFKEKGFSYVTLDSSRERDLAINDPELFLSNHPFPLIIDEIQRAPNLFSSIQEIVNKEKLKRNDNYGMYILTGSSLYSMMKNVTQSNAGRISIIHISPLSRNEIIGREEIPFSLEDLSQLNKRIDPQLNSSSLYDLIVRGMYPELYSNLDLESSRYYSDYLETYLERDVSQLINVKDKLLFSRFMELIASLTGEELIYDRIAKTLGVDIKTVQSWISILLAGDIIYLLEPYNEYSMTKRIVRRPKLYFSDTGLACYLSRLDLKETLMKSIFSERFVETYIVNEIRKSYFNNSQNASFYYYRDTNQNEIDLIIVQKGKITKIECKSGIRYTFKDIKSFKTLTPLFEETKGGIVCLTDTIYPLDDKNYSIPISSI